MEIHQRFPALRLQHLIIPMVKTFFLLSTQNFAPFQFVSAALSSHCRPPSVVLPPAHIPINDMAVEHSKTHLSLLITEQHQPSQSHFVHHTSHLPSHPLLDSFQDTDEFLILGSPKPGTGFLLWFHNGLIERKMRFPRPAG